MPEENMRISLVIPAYNEEKYIADCLNYVIQHTKGKLFEIIVVDNASTDRTREVAESIEGVTVITENSKGVVHARQKGFSEAKGNIIAFIDADTRISEDWIDIMIEEFSSDPTLVCLSGPCSYHDIPKHQQLLVKAYWDIGSLAYLITKYMIISGNFAIKRDVLEKMEGFDTSIAFYGDDTDVARRAYEFGKVKFDKKFGISTSGRRFDGQGLLKTGVLYMVNFVSEVTIKKPATKKYKDIR